MAIKRLAPNKWWILVSVRIPGQSQPVKRRKTITGTKTDAEIHRAGMIEAIRKGTPGSLKTTEAQNFSDAAEVFREKRGPFSDSHERKISFLAKELGGVSLDGLPDTFERWLRVLRNTPTKHGRQRSAASLNRYLEIVRSIFGLLVELEQIPKNPISKARFPKLKEEPRDRYLNQDERIRLLNAIQTHRPYLLPFVRYSLLVPCRKSELTEARREQYNPFNGTIYIPDSKADIPIYKPVPDELREYFDSIPADCPYLFYRQDKNGEYFPLGDFKNSWRFCVQAAGLQNVRVHDLRHVSATDLYEAGNPERVIMDIAGWKTPMLSRYRHKDSYRSAKAIRFGGHKRGHKEDTTLENTGVFGSTG